MSTRAHIGIRNSHNTVHEIIFTHWYGYPSHHGPILLKYYRNTKQVRALMASGNHESLWPKPHLGDTWGKSNRFDTFDDMCKGLHDSWAEYIYIFDVKHKRWLFSSMSGLDSMSLKPLTLKDCEVEE